MPERKVGRILGVSLATGMLALGAGICANLENTIKSDTTNYIVTKAKSFVQPYSPKPSEEDIRDIIEKGLEIYTRNPNDTYMIVTAKKQYPGDTAYTTAEKSGVNQIKNLLEDPNFTIEGVNLYVTQDVNSSCQITINTLLNSDLNYDTHQSIVIFHSGDCGLLKNFLPNFYLAK